MALAQVINENAVALAECKSGNWAAAVTALLADTVAVRDEQLRTTRWLMVEFPDQVPGEASGVTEADVILGTLQASTIPRVKAAYDAMSSGGIDLSDDQVQQMLPALALAADWPAGLADRVAEKGVRTMSVAEAATGNAPTEADVQSAFEADQVEAFDRKAVLLSLNRRANGKASFSVRVTNVGESASGSEVKGETALSVSSDASQPHSDAKVQTLIEAVNAAVDAYLGD